LNLQVRSMSPIPRTTSRHPSTNLRVGDALIELKFHADALRTVRTGIMSLAYALGQTPGTVGFLVLVDPLVTEERIRAEWQLAKSFFKSELLSRLTICIEQKGRLRGVPRDPTPEMQAVIEQAILRERPTVRAIRPDYSFIVIKLLIHQWLVSNEPVTMDWLGKAAGSSFPTIARVLKQLGSIVERTSDRRVRLRYFPQEEFDRLLANSEAARSTTRFVDRSGQPRSPESRVRRLEKMRPEGVAIGGVLGARHYNPDIDLIGTPRLDLSVSCGKTALPLDFIKELDPALTLETDPRKSASVVVHAVRHADPLFRARPEGLAWADPVECLLDLQEVHLESQMQQFLEALKERRTNAT